MWGKEIPRPVLGISSMMFLRGVQKQMSSRQLRKMGMWRRENLISVASWTIVDTLAQLDSAAAWKDHLEAMVWTGCAFSFGAQGQAIWRASSRGFAPQDQRWVSAVSDNKLAILNLLIWQMHGYGWYVGTSSVMFQPLKEGSNFMRLPLPLSTK